MELFTDKNKKQFERWFNKQIKQVNVWDLVQFNAYELELFEQLPIEMQIGVILAYYDSLEVRIQTIFKHRDGWNWKISYKTKSMNPYKVVEGNLKCCYHFDKAFTEAAKQANEIINQKLK